MKLPFLLLVESEFLSTQSAGPRPEDISIVDTSGFGLRSSFKFVKHNY